MKINSFQNDHGNIRVFHIVNANNNNLLWAKKKLQNIHDRVFHEI